MGWPREGRFSWVVHAVKSKTQVAKTVRRSISRGGIGISRHDLAICGFGSRAKPVNFLFRNFRACTEELGKAELVPPQYVTLFAHNSHAKVQK